VISTTSTKQNVALVERFMIPITILKLQIATIWKGNLIPSPGKTGSISVLKCALLLRR